MIFLINLEVTTYMSWKGHSTSWIHVDNLDFASTVRCFTSGSGQPSGKGWGLRWPSFLGVICARGRAVAENSASVDACDSIEIRESFRTWLPNSSCYQCGWNHNIHIYIYVIIYIHIHIYIHIYMYSIWCWLYIPNCGYFHCILNNTYNGEGIA